MIGQLPNEEGNTLLSLINTNLQRCDLRALEFADAGLEYCHLDGAILLGTKLEYGALVGTSFRGAMLEGAQLVGAAVFGSNFLGATGLSNEQIGVTLGDSSVIISPDRARPAHWPNFELTWEQRRKWLYEVRNSHEPTRRPDWLPS